MTLRVAVPDVGWIDRLGDIDEVDFKVWDFTAPLPDGRWMVLIADVSAPA